MLSHQFVSIQNCKDEWGRFAPPLIFARSRRKKFFVVFAIAISAYTSGLSAQTILLPPLVRPDLPPKNIIPTAPFKLPSPDRLLAPANSQPSSEPQVPNDSNTELIVVKQFEVIGNSVFSEQAIEAITKLYTNRPISIIELLQVRTKITELYIENGYISSGAYLPEQDLQTGTVKIEIIEGGLDEIRVTGLNRLNSGYIQSRLAIATQKPLNRTRLLEALQLLQLNPLIESISANLSPSLQVGTNNLGVKVTEAKTLSLPIIFDNSRTPSVGSERRQIQFIEANLTGMGDRLSLAYTNTNGSNSIDASYTIPFNPYNGTISLNFGTSSSKVIETPFNALDIISNSRNYELSIRQPILQNTVQDLALGLTLSHRQSNASLFGGAIPFPSLGADADGQTKVTTLRFFQEYVHRSSEDAIAARSQFSIGLGAFGATINATSPDSQFLSWRGQAQYVRLLAPETLLFLRADLQLSDRPILPQEQISLGGQDTLRGYRQDTLLSDNGLLLSAEMRIPILRIPEVSGLLQIVPFFDFGTAWNRQANTTLDPSTLASVGLGLRLQMSDRLTMRLDLGIPLSRNNTEKKTWQENGIYFSVVANPF